MQIKAFFDHSFLFKNDYQDSFYELKNILFIISENLYVSIHFISINLKFI